MTLLRLSALLSLATVGLTACVEARTLNPEFGEAYRQNLISQVAEPDPHYVGDPAPGSAGTRVGLAQTRYRTGTVIKPIPATASEIGRNNGGNGNGGAGVGVAAQ